MSLQIQYSKKIAKELGKVAVYFPGEDINVGDIVQFPHGNGIFRTAPFGSFKKITDLKGLGVHYDESADSGSPDTYRFTSKDSVHFNTGFGGSIDSGSKDAPNGNGKLQISFSKEGAIFFYAVDCMKQSLNNIQNLENEINDHGKKMLWENTFLVTSLTVAKKALIAQSISKNSKLVLGGDVKGMQLQNSLQLDIDANINIEKKSGTIFIKEWSDNVSVFIDVMRFKKNVFQTEKLFDADTKIIDHPSSKGIITLESVDISEYLNEHTFQKAS